MNWNPDKNIAIIIDDKTGDKKIDEKLEKTIEETRKVINKYYFDIYGYGSMKCFEKSIKLKILDSFKEKILNME